MASGLSARQWDVLRWLCAVEREILASADPIRKRDLARVGVPWAWRRKRRLTAAIRASDSRTLARLAQRGLVARRNIGHGGAAEQRVRTTHVKITADGRAAHTGRVGVTKS